ncbi:L-histidine N(alpha)-methyltransferase [Rhodopila sp.]|uniref:L-histidine N(alpha)-methyltransferase n=1 Tax=Rhodopila sp. TaxID=2480087 RepID=UPI003D0E8E1E
MPNDSGLVRRPGGNDVVDAALSGLMASPKTLPPRLFYDEEGCRLFYEITTLPEYYLTRTEKRLLSDHAREMVPADVANGTLVEFGGSDEDKARYLLDLKTERHQPIFKSYVPIDIAAGALAAMQSRLRGSHPRLNVSPIVADFTQPLQLSSPDAPCFGFFPGSTIGNLDPAAAVDFLRSAAASLGGKACLLLGADLRKSPETVLPAYNDSAGVTAAFNLNLLRRLNREAHADFDLTGFRHEAIWNGSASRIEMHLVARRDQVVTVAGHRFAFGRGESIHTENSYKHSPEALISLARTGGWINDKVWTDRAGLFGIFLFCRT